MNFILNCTYPYTIYTEKKHFGTGQHIDCEHPEIIGYDKMKIMLQIKETLQTRKRFLEKNQ